MFRKLVYRDVQKTSLLGCSENFTLPRVPKTKFCLQNIQGAARNVLSREPEYFSFHFVNFPKELGDIKRKQWYLHAKPDASISFIEKPQNVVFSIIRK